MAHRGAYRLEAAQRRPCLEADFHQRRLGRRSNQQQRVTPVHTTRRFVPEMCSQPDLALAVVILVRSVRARVRLDEKLGFF